MTEPVIKTESLQVYHVDALAMLPTLAAGSVHCIITDPPYCSMNRHREVGTTTRMGGHHDPEKRTGWFDTITNEELYGVLCEFARLLPRNGHAWVMADNETQAIIQGFVREGETGFDYVKSYPLIKLRTDGQAPKMGGGLPPESFTRVRRPLRKGAAQVGSHQSGTPLQKQPARLLHDSVDWRGRDAPPHERRQGFRYGQTLQSLQAAYPALQLRRRDGLRPLRRLGPTRAGGASRKEKGGAH